MGWMARKNAEGLRLRCERYYRERLGLTHKLFIANYAAAGPPTAGSAGLAQDAVAGVAAQGRSPRLLPHRRDANERCCAGGAEQPGELLHVGREAIAAREDAARRDNEEFRRFLAALPDQQ